MAYPKPERKVGETTTVLRSKRKADKIVEHRRDLPGNIILIHGVNDVGAGYRAAEEGLCAGLEQRLYRHFKAGAYVLPGAQDKGKLVDDPDAVFFKRTVADDTDSPVIPFYWGYREVRSESGKVNGQFTDRYGNRLDKDLSKGGGPFANATSSLPDMWNRGVYAPLDPVRDSLRPVKTAPGRMYMVLAASRLAALVSMIRDYEPADTVTLVAHSQGCLLSLLAQALLMQRGERTADTLILTHPPYSLDEEMGTIMKGLNYFQGGKDTAMEPFYELIGGRQSLHGRLQTLVNIVQGVAKARKDEPAFASINEAKHGGMVEGRWKPDGDRDNRGKVYLYFSPEDMTVALDNIRGIGWQGVPEYMDGSESKFVYVDRRRATRAGMHGHRRHEWKTESVVRMPLKELGETFRQRVFTDKRRPGPVLVGQPPHDFILRVEGEDDHAHVAASGRSKRESLPVARWPVNPDDKPEQQRFGIRRITGEALRAPCRPDIRGKQIEPEKIPATSRHAGVPQDDRGPMEEVDPITAAIAVTSSSGLNSWQEERPDPTGAKRYPSSPQELPASELAQMTLAYNQEKQPLNTDPNNNCRIIRAVRHTDGRVVATIQESPNAARLRWQHELSAKSFHSVIFASRENHRQVTAYDVAIGSGKASSDPVFYKYLCAVADWRLKKPGKAEQTRRAGVLRWEDFQRTYSAYLDCEPRWRHQLIDGSADYYSTGNLPPDLPVLTGTLWDIVIAETVGGERINRPNRPSEER